MGKASNASGDSELAASAGGGVKLSAGLPGFLLVCDPHREAKATRETMALLQEFVEAASAPSGDGEAAPAAAAGVTAPVSDALEAELAALRDGGSARVLRWHDTSCHGLVFIQLLKNASVDPWVVLKPLLAACSQAPRVRFTHRLVPVHTTSHASLESIEAAAKPMLAEKLASPKPTRYAIIFGSRAHNTVKRDDAIKLLASLVPPHHIVDLKTPQTLLVCELFKGVACLAVVDAPYAQRRFGLKPMLPAKGKASADT